MRRSFERELLESARLSESEVERVHKDMTVIHRALGDSASILSAVRRDPLPVRRILDVGCGAGGVLRYLCRRLPVEAVGIDLRPPRNAALPFRIHQADATREPLPRADIAFSMYLGHHLSEGELVRLIRNVGCSCRRFLLLDLVRHPLPLAMFRLFAVPFVSAIAAVDGQTSIRRSYTPRELRQIAAAALAGTGARFRHSVAPFYVRQTLDISYAGG